MHRPPALDPAVSLAEYAASSVHAPEPVGRTLRALAERAFTGEALFRLGTGVLVYLDVGHPYYAERVGEAPLGERLVAAGVLAERQLRQGMIQVGDVEHLGRLFDRESTIDRDAVLAATELITDEVLSEIAPHDAAVEFTSYRHHRSGVHRWFVGPGRRAPLRPVEGVAQVDRSLFDALPEVTPAHQQTGAALPAPAALAEEPELIIEWDEPDPAGLGPPQPEPESQRQPIVDLTPDVDATDEPRPPLLPPLPAPVVAAPTESPPAPSADSPEDLAATDATAEPDEPRTSFDVAPMSLESALAAIEQTPPDHDADPAAEPEPAVQPVADVAPSVEPVSEPVVAPDQGFAAPVVTAEPEPEPVASESASDGFMIRWPDGSQQATEAIDPTALSRPEPATVPVTVGEQDAPVVLPDDSSVAAASSVADEAPAAADSAVADGVPPVSPLLAAPDPTSDEPSEPLDPVEFEMPSLRVEQLPEPDAEVPDDVADAVRRALAAIERASVEPDVNARLRSGGVDLPDFAMPKLLDRSAVVEPTEPRALAAPNPPATAGEAAAPTVAGPDSVPLSPPAHIATTQSVIGEPLVDATPGAPSAPVPGAFAPPTAAMSAEAVYARLAAEREAAPLPEPGKATVVFVEPEVEHETEHDERKGALKRLIGSLRRK